MLRRLPAPILMLFTALALPGCGGALDTHTAEAARIAHLWWVTFGIATALFVIIMAIFGYALFRRRNGEPAAFEARPATAITFILVAGAGLPLLILIAVFAYSVQITAANDATVRGPLHVEVIGHNWWWEFRYTDSNFRTVNSLHIPAGRAVELTLTADDVIHSFWVPQLNGKVDAIPGIQNKLTIASADAGSYRGVCAEFCGVGHNCMPFETVVDQPQDFAAWEDQVKALPFRKPERDDVQFMLNVCVNENQAPVCMPAGCPQPLPSPPANAGPTPVIPQFQPGAGSPSNPQPAE
jgi:cytochrome c oxidase subunit II